MLRASAPDDEERELESMLFGGAEPAVGAEEEEAEEGAEAEEEAEEEGAAGGGAPLFWVDNTGDGGNGGGNAESEDDVIDKNVTSELRNDHSSSSSSSSSSAAASRKRAKRAWVDDDNDNLEVDLAGVNRTRKLRKAQAESVVGGAEYAARLKTQYNRAHAHTGAARWSKLKDTPANGAGLGSDSESGSEDEDGGGDGGGGDGGDDASGDVLRSTSSTVARGGGAGGLLRAGEIKVLRVKDANAAAPSKNASIQSVRFMRRAMGGGGGSSASSSSASGSTPLLLTAGLDKTLRLFSIDGKTNRKVQSVFVRDLPISCAEFSPTRDEVILAGRRSFFYVYDMNASKVKRIPKIVGREEKSLERFVMSPDGKWITFLGNDGYAIMVDANTKRWVCDLKMNGSIRAAAFSPDGCTLRTSGGDGQVYVWDLRTRRCVDRHADEGAVHSTSLAASANMYAAGADSGVVNLYSTSLGSANSMLSSGARRRRRGPLAVAMQLARPPFKTIMSLTTRADTLRFNHDGQILAIASQMKKDSLRLIHAHTGKTFANWPTASTPLRYVTDVDFSPGGGLMAIGNDRGRVLLYRLLHYANL